jgi:hypothetical protein
LIVDKNPAVAGMDRPFRDLQMTPQRSTEVKGQGVVLLIGQRWTYFSIGTPGLGAAVEKICATFTFVTLEKPLKGQPRSKLGKSAVLLIGQRWAYFSIGTPGLGAAVGKICATFTFVTWGKPLKGQLRSKVKV